MVSLRVADSERCLNICVVFLGIHSSSHGRIDFVRWYSLFFFYSGRDSPSQTEERKHGGSTQAVMLYDVRGPKRVLLLLLNTSSVRFSIFMLCLLERPGRQSISPSWIVMVMDAPSAIRYWIFSVHRGSLVTLID